MSLPLRALSLTEGQIALIKRYTPNIKILYDGDAAGIKAALRGLDLVLEQDMNVKICSLPDGEDPDSYMQKIGATAFEAYTKQEAKDFILFKTDLLLKEAAVDPVKKTELIRDIVQSISKIPDPIKRSLYIKQCAQLMEVEEDILIAESNKIIAQVIKKKQQKAFFNQSNNPAPFSDSGQPMPEITIPGEKSAIPLKAMNFRKKTSFAF